MSPPINHHRAVSDLNKEEMRPGMAFTIEPILMPTWNLDLVQWNDGWSLHTPGVPSTQWEHIVLITDGGHKILTRREGEVFPDNYKP